MKIIKMVSAIGPGISEEEFYPVYGDNENHIIYYPELIYSSNGQDVTHKAYQRPDCEKECPVNDFDDNGQSACSYAKRGGNCKFFCGYVPEEKTPQRDDKILNYTPHKVVVSFNSIPDIFESVGVARVAEKNIDIHGGFRPCVRKTYVGIEGLPEPAPNTWYIVSLVVFQNSDRKDLLCPDTGLDSAIRDGKGRIIAVQRFMVK